MLWLDGLLQDLHNIHLQLIEVRFVTRQGREREQRLLGVVFTPVEAPVNEILDTPAQGGEQGRDGQGGDHRNDLRLALAGQAAQQVLQGDDGAQVDQPQSKVSVE
jgi:hypothetical protein